MFERYGGPGLVPLQSRFWLALSLAALGEFGDAMAVAEEARHAAATVQHPYSLAFAEYVMGRLLVEQRALEPAVAALEHARALIHRREIVHIRPLGDGWLGYAHALCGRPEEGIALLRPAIDEAARARPAGRGLLVVCLAEALLLGGRSAEALRRAQQGLALTRALGERGHEAIMLEALARAHAATGDPASAAGAPAEPLGA